MTLGSFCGFAWLGSSVGIIPTTDIFLQCALQCQVSDNQKLMAVLHNIKSQAQIFGLKICTFPRLSSYCGQDLHEGRTKYVEALQEVKMSKIKSEPKFAECQNLERSPTSAEQSIKCRSYGGWRGSHSCPRGNLCTSSTSPAPLLSIMNK